MRLYEDDGTTRELEGWEVTALEAAQREHDAAIGYVRPYTEARAREVFTGMLVNQADLPAEEALRMVTLFPSWSPGAEYPAGYRVRYGDDIFTVLQAHAAQASWEPPMTPSLYAKLLPGQGGTAVGEWSQPDSTNPYSKGDRVAHGGKTWESLVDGNVWEPGAAGSEALWAEVDDADAS